MTEQVETATVAEAEAPKVEKAPKDEQNGIVRPKAGTKTSRVWEISDAMSAKLGEPAPRKPVLEEAVSEGLNPSTAATQYGRWRKYHGLVGRGDATPSAEEAGSVE